jgi:hypothetical protein
MRGDTGTVELVIDSGADINAFDNVSYCFCNDYVLHDKDQDLLVVLLQCMTSRWNSA